MIDLYIMILLWFLTPIGIFCLFWKFKKPLWSAAVYLPLLLCDIYQDVFSYRSGGFWQELEQFMHNDSAMIFYFCWLPGIVGFVLIHIAYFVHKGVNSKKEVS